jgi:hypothetical protein
VIVSMDLASLRRSSWYEWALRFVLGGLVTVVAGLMSKFFGPVFGGLFLAFPAIMSASATLIEKHERQKKMRAGIDGTARARKAAGLDAAGAELGCVGLAAFALLTWKQLPHHAPALVLIAAAVLWLLVSITLWWIGKRHILG